MTRHDTTHPPSADTNSAVQEFWRGLDELADDAEFRNRLTREFPRGASVWDETSLSRRRFLELMAASLALSGMAGCTTEPVEKIVPYVRPPRDVVPGIPLYFATAMPRPAGALGLLVTSHLGRPTKVEGNELHPASLGATDAQAQASILEIYDPDRSQAVMRDDEISTWSEALTAMRSAIDQLRQRNGAGVHLLTEPVVSPTLHRQIEELLEMLPEARWHQYTPINRDNIRAAMTRLYDRDLHCVYDFQAADVVVSLDADFLCQAGDAVRYARDFMSRRQPQGRQPMSRLYVIESAYTPTGAAADHRLPLKPRHILAFARKLARELGIDLPQTPSDATAANPQLDAWARAAAEDLRRAGSAGLVVAGDQQPLILHALAHAINRQLESFGSAVRLTRPIQAAPVDNLASLKQLTDALQDGQVDLLVILEGNPAYNAPAEVPFANALAKARQSVHLSLYYDETSRLCHWHIPAAHYLESWSDARGFDGTAAIVQPLIAPLYRGKTPHEILLGLMGRTESGYEAVRATWQQNHEGDFDDLWHQSLEAGVISGTEFQPETGAIDAAALAEQLQRLPSPYSQDDSSSAGESLEVVFRPDPSIGDGRFANNAWLQELPKPLSKLTWENAMYLAPATAADLGVRSGDRIELRIQKRAVHGPVLVMPGHAGQCVTVSFGYGREAAGRVGGAIGFNAYRLWSGERGWCETGGKITAVAGRAELAVTQTHHAIDGRGIVHRAPLDQYLKAPDSVAPKRHELASLYPEYEYEGLQWGMSIDLTKCTGCNACVVACQAENNIPVVGKEQVRMGREMHWLRIDSYYQGESANPAVVQQPMLCQHCEKAPCEIVCPVAATTHSDEGLNEMTYNRCVGTRYCSNNCPYKVRRFNFLQYQDETTPVLKLMRNPDVTVRSRGVMEKCTYCVQRINRARVAAKIEAVESGQPLHIPDGAVQTACQAACPARAIIFGNINDNSSEVARRKADPRNYGVLAELGTQPRTTYLVQIRNLNPRLK